MRRILPLLLCLGLALGLCACGGAPESAAPATAASTAVPAVPEESAPTPPPATPAPTPAVTPVVVTPTPEPRWVRGEETVTYTVLAAQRAGAEALTIWLLGEGRELLAAFGTESVGESMFLPAGADRSGERIPPATDDTRLIRLTADSRLTECGLLAVLIPAFENRYGYTVEITAASGDALTELAPEADAAILAETETAPLRREGVFYSYWTFASTQYDKEELP